MGHPTPISRRAALAGACALLLEAFAARAADAPAKPGPAKPRLLDWMDLLPDDERRRAMAPEAFEHDYLGEDGPPALQRGSFAINPRLNNSFVKVPGFVVPLSLTGKTLGEFLLVPYFGACIHMPPPPPNQIVYVKLQKPVYFKSIWDPFWITGTLSAATKDTNLATAAYTLAGVRVEPYAYK